MQVQPKSPGSLFPPTGTACTPHAPTLPAVALSCTRGRSELVLARAVLRVVGTLALSGPHSVKRAVKIGKETTAGDSEAGQSKDARKTGHRFARGNSFGKGRPQGSRNKATIALQALLDEEGEQITRKAIEMAKAGDSAALRLVIDRLIPPVRERRLSLELPKIETPAGVVAAIGVVLDAVGAGKITPSEGQALAGLLEAQRKNMETLELEARVAAVEQSIKNERKQ